MTNRIRWQGAAITFLCIVASTTILKLMLIIFTGNAIPVNVDLLIVLVYLLVINFVTHIFGIPTGLVAALLAFLTYNYSFIEPVGTFHVSRSSDILVLLIFLVFAVLNSQWLGQARAQQLQAEYRERDTTMLYETSLALSSIYHLDEALMNIAKRVQSFLRANRVEIVIDNAQLNTVVSYPSASVVLPTKPIALHTIDLLSSQGIIGKIKIDRAMRLNADERRLVQTFAGLTTLAVERIRAMQAEAKTRVLEESDRLKSALLSSVSHELRTPIAAIQAGTESLHHQLIDPHSPQGKDLIANMDDAVRHLSKLVNNLLDMSRIEAGALKPMNEWADLSEVIYDTVARLRSELMTHQVSIAIPNDLPLVFCDPIQIGQVISNLVSNSVKYAPIHTPIDITAELTQDWVLIQVSNASEHIPVAYLDRIFDKFFRVTHADRVLGTGLGLSICKGIVEAHGGKIWAHNHTQQATGVTFAFTLPYLAHQMTPLPELE